MTGLRSYLYLFAPLVLFLLASLTALVLHGEFYISRDWADTAHYAAIAENGYAVLTDTAFFPGFPYLWSILGLSATGMAAFNLLLWLAALLVLDRVCGIQRRALLLSAMVPQVIFFAIPYSESLFFVAGLLVVLGLHKEKWWLTLVGVFLAALIRPTAAVIIPALFLARLFSGTSWKNLFGKALGEGLAGLLGVACVFYLQSSYTGDFFAFFKAQASWGNGFAWPKLPLNSWGGPLITIIDGMALFVGLFAGRTLWHTRRGGRTVLTTSERFGLAGLFLTALLILFTRGGWLFSLNRFVFATVFFPLALSAWSRTIYVNRQFAALFVAWVLFSFALASYVHIRAFLYYQLAGAIIVIVIYALRRPIFRGWVAVMLLGISIAIMVYIYQAGGWLG